MAVHLSIGRISSISLLALLVLAAAAGAAHYLSRSGPEPAPAPASQIAAAVPSPAVPSPSALEPAAGTVPGSPAETATRHDPEPVKSAERMPDAEAEPEVVAEAEVEVAAEPETEAVVVAGAEAEVEVAAEPEIEAVVVAGAEAEVEAEVEAAPAPATALAVPPAVEPAADAVQTASVPVAAPTVAPFAATEPAAPRRRVTIANLAIEPQHPPVVRDPVRSASRPKNMAPIPTRAPRAAAAASMAVRSAAKLFQSGAEIRIEKDANLYITARNIPDNDSLLEAYNADRPNGGRVRTRFGEATMAPGLLGIAAQAHRAKGGGQGSPTYSLADAMRDAIWRKETAARLKSLTVSQSACADGAAKRTPSIGLIASC